MTADPYIGNPLNLQDYNRYSYVNNNPLAYTDPSGYLRIRLGPIKISMSSRDVKAIAGIAVAAWVGFGDFTWLTGSANGLFGAGTLATAASAGFAGGVVSSGSLEGGLHGALSGSLFYGAGQLAGAAGFAQDSFGRALFHAAAGCAAASASGGDCGRGAVAAGFTKYVGANTPFNEGVAAVVKWAVIGGTASRLAGGKFANGAVTGSFQYMFNQAFAVPRGGVPAGVDGVSKEDKAIARGLLRMWNRMFNEEAPPEQDAGNQTADEAGKASRRPSADVRRRADQAATDENGDLRCDYCGDKLTTEPGHGNSREYDHVTPWSRGGDSSAGNIVDSCRTCNRSKGARTPEEWGGPR